MMEKVVKAYLVDAEGQTEEARRFVLPSVPKSTLYSTLVSKVTTVFPSLVGQSSRDLKITWIDDEEDEIAISCDDEVVDALGYNNLKDILKIYIRSATSGSHEEQKTPNQDDNEPLHPNVICDGCNGQIRGKRFRCLVCDDYDLCSSCKAKGIHWFHEMILVPTPFMFRAFPFFCNIGKKANMDQKCSGASSNAGSKCSGTSGNTDPKCSGNTGSRPSTSKENANDQNARGTFAADGNYNINLQDMIRKGLAGLENWKRQASAENNFAGVPDATQFLNNIGENIATLLDSWGINVTVDVEQPSGGSAETKPKESAESKKPTNVSSDGNESEASKDEQTEPKSGNQTSTSASDANTPQAEGAGNGSPSAASNSSKDSDAGDWTVINEAASAGTEKNIPATTVRFAEAELADAGTAMEIGDSSSTQEVPRWQPVHPTNPRIAEAMSQMLSMGFSNEGNWLLRLVEAKGGNIGAVLDSLHPMQR